MTNVGGAIELPDHETMQSGLSQIPPNFGDTQCDLCNRTRRSSWKPSQQKFLRFPELGPVLHHTTFLHADEDELRLKTV